MLTLIPIFITTTNTFWHSNDAKKILLKPIIASINAQEIHTTIVCSNDTSILEAIGYLNIKTYHIDITEEDQPASILPQGSLSAVRYIIKSFKPKLTDILILSYKNPLITSEHINQAVRQYHLSQKEIAISACKPVDHPCQFETYYKIISNGFIHIFERDKTILTHWLTKIKNILRKKSPCDNTLYKISKSFHFDWSSKQIAMESAHDIYYRTCLNDTVRYQAIEHRTASSLNGMPTVFWLYENKHKARVLIRSPPKSYPDSTQIIGCTIPTADNKPYAKLFIDKNTASLHFKYRDTQSHSARYLLKSIGIKDLSINGKIEEYETEINDLSKLIPVPYQTDQLSGVLYSLLQYSNNESSDISEHFFTPENLWVGTGTHQHTNTKTGKAIRGRQDFPDIFRIEESLFIFKKDVMLSLPQEINHGNVHFVPIDNDFSIQINNRLDFLKLRAMSRAAQLG